MIMPALKLGKVSSWAKRRNHKFKKDIPHKAAGLIRTYDLRFLGVT
jgi:hypothetical protein